jgi:hypothetical protein
VPFSLRENGHESIDPPIHPQEKCFSPRLVETPYVLFIFRLRKNSADKRAAVRKLNVSSYFNPQRDIVSDRNYRRTFLLLSRRKLPWHKQAGLADVTWNKIGDNYASRRRFGCDLYSLPLPHRELPHNRDETYPPARIYLQMFHSRSHPTRRPRLKINPAGYRFLSKQSDEGSRFHLLVKIL